MTPQAADVMQEAYVAAFTHLSATFRVRSRLRFSTWLTRIAVNESLARLRRGRRLEPLGDVETEARPMASPARNPEQRASDGELRGILEQAIDALPDGFRAVFVLRAVEQLSVAETSEALDVPEETVKTRLHRARGLLRESARGDRVRQRRLPTVFDFSPGRAATAWWQKVLGRIRALRADAASPHTIFTSLNTRNSHEADIRHRLD